MNAAGATSDVSEATKKVALVTGGTRGIGFGIAKQLARDGYNLVLGYNSNSTTATEAQSYIESTYGATVYTVGGDVSEKSTMDALFDCVKSNFDNRLTAFVHNAGLYIGLTSTSDSAPSGSDFEDTWPYYHRVYVLAFKRGLNKALQCEGLKHVVAISSPGCNANQVPRVGYESPGQAKAGLEFLVRTHGLQLAYQGINVNCIIPGYTKTPAWDKVMASSTTFNEEQLNKRVEATPAHRWIAPEEIGNVAAFLCSSHSSMITGMSIPVDGGLHLSTR